jgi:hypothetical protein
LLALVLAALAATGCKRTVKGEEARWASVNRTADEISALYPGFKPAVEERRTAARALHDAAQKLADDEQRIGKLSEASNVLGRGFLRDLGGVDDRVRKIRAQLVEVSGAAADPAAERRLAQAKENVTRVLGEVDARLRRGAADGKSADALATKIAADLKSAEDQLAMVAPAKPEAAAATAKDGKPAAGAAPAAETWTCEFCNHANATSLTKCDNCGAARPAPK